ncbi:hypothetical protein B0T10DRAFT_520486 [Thelonectria olida]|uniref:3-carboxymuconate cyclase n=1 Tax=Thelonectria olida TaxID=1576542 RepID=A0A9P8VX18_9HYPO|nr:hypothetical protein B0T10DRAFT_520486 [Thelonectria olida]
MHTRIFSFLLSLAPLVLDVSAHPSRCDTGYKSTKAIYMLTNDAKNAVIALPIGSDGMLSKGTSTEAGGAGSNSIMGSTGQPAGPDALVSQSSLTVAGNHLFAVNAGSNTITMFAIDRHDPTKLTMIGQPVAVPGEFPNTVAASKKNKLVCAGSTGAKAGVSCSSFSSKGMSAMDELRPFALKQTTPPVGPTNTVSQVFFSADESTLFTTVKGDPTKNNTGFLSAFPVRESRRGSAYVSHEGAQSSPEGTAVLFGSSTIPGSNDLFVTDASFGAAVLSVDSRTDMATIKGKGAIPNQKATCWVAVSAATKTAFVTDVATNRLVEMSLTDASIQGTVDLSANGDPGLIDLRAAGNLVYALSPGNGTTQAAVTVVDAFKKVQVQHFELGSMGAGKNAQGMAVKL